MTIKGRGYMNSCDEIKKGLDYNHYFDFSEGFADYGIVTNWKMPFFLLLAGPTKATILKMIEEIILNLLEIKLNPR